MLEELAKHLILNSKRLRTFEDARLEVVTHVEAKFGLRIRDSKPSATGARGHSDPMDVDASSPRDGRCKCGGAHFQRDCNARKSIGKQPSGKGKQSKSRSKSEGKGKSKENKSNQEEKLKELKVRTRAKHRKLVWNDSWNGDEWNDGWSYDAWNDDWSSLGWHEVLEQTYLPQAHFSFGGLDFSATSIEHIPIELRSRRISRWKILSDCQW